MILAMDYPSDKRWRLSTPPHATSSSPKRPRQSFPLRHDDALTSAPPHFSPSALPMASRHQSQSSVTLPPISRIATASSSAAPGGGYGTGSGSGSGSGSRPSPVGSGKAALAHLLLPSVPNDHPGERELLSRRSSSDLSGGRSRNEGIIPASELNIGDVSPTTVPPTSETLPGFAQTNDSQGRMRGSSQISPLTTSGERLSTPISYAQPLSSQSQPQGQSQIRGKGRQSPPPLMTLTPRPSMSAPSQMYSRASDSQVHTLGHTHGVQVKTEPMAQSAFHPPLPNWNRTQRPSTSSVGTTASSSASISTPDAWFALGTVPVRVQYGWSREKVDAYNAGWEDALRSVEAGIIGIKGQQYNRPMFISKDIPPSLGSSSAPPAATIGPIPGPGPGPGSAGIPPHRQSSQPPSSSYMGYASGGPPFPPPPQHRPEHEYPQSSYSQQQQQQQQPSYQPSFPPPSRSSSFSYGHGHGHGQGRVDRQLPSGSTESSYRRPSTSSTLNPHTPPSHTRPLLPATVSYPPQPPAHAHGHVVSPPTQQKQHQPQNQHQLQHQMMLERKSRQAISCYPCRGRKLKCDGLKPCAQCLRRGGAEGCEYAVAIKRRGKGRKVNMEGEEIASDDEFGDSHSGRSGTGSVGPGGERKVSVE